MYGNSICQCVPECSNPQKAFRSKDRQNKRNWNLGINSTGNSMKQCQRSLRFLLWIFGKQFSVSDFFFIKKLM